MTKKKETSGNGKGIMIFWLLVFIPVFLFFAMMWGAKTGNLGFDDLPDLADLENPKSNLASEIITSDGKTMGKYFLQNRTNAKYEDLSPFLVDALIATEDERFRAHSGIDFRGLVRAVSYLGSAGGASTITQQLAKMMFHERETATFVKKIKQKLQEQIIAVELEKRYTKDEIILMYYNKFDFIYNAVGIKSAGHVYFKKKPIDLTIEEAAVLVGMAKNPSLYNPKRFPENAMKRREVVFSQMKRSELITQQEYDSLRVLPIVLNYQPVDHKEGIAPYFRETLRLKLKKLFKEKDADGNYLYAKTNGEPYNIYKDGLKIFTTINKRMQEHAEFAVEEYIAKTLQKQFSKYLNRVRTKNYPYDGGTKGLSSKQYLSLVKSSKVRTPRYRILTGKECFNCGRRGRRNVKKEGAYYVCQHDDCGKKIWATTKDSVDLIFDKKIKMSVFSHAKRIDTLLSPNDSILYYKTFLHTGLMSVDPRTGYIKAWVGGVNYEQFGYDHVTSTRQVGSTFKPFVYVTAIQNGYSPCYEVPNVKTTFHRGEFGLLEEWTPKNAGGINNGCNVSLKYAIANSMNTTTAWVMKQFGPQAVIEQARNMGIKNKLDPVPSLCLGVADLSVYEMVGANATFANKGVYIEPTMYTRIEDKHGNVIVDVNPETKEAMSEETAYVMLDLMKGIVDGEYNKCMGDDRLARGKRSARYKNGTGTRLRGSITEKRPYAGHTYPIAGKTGTTQNNSDGWFMGLTPDLVTGVWVGADERAVRFGNTVYGQGANTALPVWAYYMQRVKADKKLNYPDKDFEPPEKPLTIELDCIKYNLMNKRGGYGGLEDWEK
jgi:penicillin-binding protein 1A